MSRYTQISANYDFPQGLLPENDSSIFTESRTVDILRTGKDPWPIRKDATGRMIGVFRSIEKGVFSRKAEKSKNCIRIVVRIQMCVPSFK